jgi:predicted anti-sigma-YlaC factor YlaD
MSECKWAMQVEAFHDGEVQHAQGVEQHLAGCAECREYLEALRVISGGVETVRQNVEIADAQFNVFMEGIEAGIRQPRFSWAALFSKVSLVAAGCVLVVALSYIVTSGPVPAWARKWIETPVNVNYEQPRDAAPAADKGFIE